VVRSIKIVRQLEEIYGPYRMMFRELKKTKKKKRRKKKKKLPIPMFLNPLRTKLYLLISEDPVHTAQ
jgi:hypothetical protein